MVALARYYFIYNLVSFAVYIAFVDRHSRRKDNTMNLLAALLFFTAAIIETTKATSETVRFERCDNSGFFRRPQRRNPDLDCGEPRNVLVKLDGPETEEFVHFEPDHVEVKRCGGSCPYDR